MSTYYFSEKEIAKKWYLVDAAEQNLGRLAVKIANILSGKNKPEYTPNADLGDFVIVINSEKIQVTGNKEKDKIYYFHSLYPGGLRKVPLWRLRKRDPNYIIRSAVWGMISHNILGRKMIGKLKIYSGENHPHSAQCPIKLD